MRIKNVFHSTGLTGTFIKDMAAARVGAKSDGFYIPGKPITPGFKSIVQAGESALIMLRLENGQVALGDGMDVIFSGAAGRDPVFWVSEHEEFLGKELPKLLEGQDVTRFRPLAEKLDRHLHNGRPLHTALRYGITQALLNATAIANAIPAAKVIANEYDCEPSKTVIPTLVSSATDEPKQLDRRILKKVDILPHSSFTNVERDIGLKGEKLLAYTDRVVKRIAEIGEPGYQPTIHLDVYGTLGGLCQNDVERIADYLSELRKVTGKHALMIESPIIMDTRQEQIETYQALLAANRRKGIDVQIIVDEWCNTLEDARDFADAKTADLLQIKMPDLGGINNTIEAVLYVLSKGLGVSLGGSLNETDISARLAAHVALACKPTYLFAKPGNGGDEGLMIVSNEMRRALILIANP